MQADDLERIRRGNMDFPETLPPTDLYGAFFDTATNLLDVIVGNEKHGFIKVGEMHWGNAHLAVVDWTQISILGDEREAKQKRYSRDDFYHKAGEAKGKDAQLFEYKVAVRANRQLAVALQSQGLNEDAVRFAY